MISLRQLFSSGSWEYEQRFSSSPETLTTLLDLALRRLLPTEAWRQKDLRDFKGRDRMNVIDGPLPPELAPLDDELLFIKGQWFSGRLGREERTKEHMLPHQFIFRLHTPFKDFEGTRHIHFRLEQYSQNLPEGIPGRALGYCVPIEIETFRVGLDMFSNKSAGAMFGTSPTVTQTILLEADLQQVKLRISSEKEPADRSKVLQHYSLFETLSEILKVVFAFDLPGSYRGKMGVAA